MILQALVKHYEDMTEKGVLAGYGWNPQKVSYVLYLDEEGNLLQAVSLKEEKKTEKGKSISVLQSMDLPAAAGGRTSNAVVANFLWDNASYILGADDKDPQRAVRRFEASRELHQKILSDVDIPAARALLAFFERWEPAQAREHSALRDQYEDILKTPNLVFRYQGKYLQEYPEIRKAWLDYYSGGEEKEEGICLVTGEKTPIAKLHPLIKGVLGAQSSGASLVSFNAVSSCSYAQEQGNNAPTGEYAAFAYGAALNHLLSQKDYVFRIGEKDNTTVLSWAEGGGKEYPGLLGCFLFGMDSSYTESELRKMVKNLLEGQPIEFEESKMDPNRPFYILGISPNAARLSVRFFLRNSFGNILRNVNAHYERLEIQKSNPDQSDNIFLWRLLGATVNQNAKDKSPSSELTGEVLRAVLTGDRYPATLLNGVTMRIRAEHRVTRERAAIIKAYYLKNPNPDVPKEVLTVSLNKESTNVPYQLGRLFSILETIQYEANSKNTKINTTIKDKYFNSASATPAVVFPTLINLAQKHLKKMDIGAQITLEKQLREVMDKLDEEYPARLTLPQQGSFQLGYYHQQTNHFENSKKKEENKNGSN